MVDTPASFDPKLSATDSAFGFDEVYGVGKFILFYFNLSFGFDAK